MASSGVAHIEYPDRANMCDIIVQYSEYIEVSRWEGEQRGFVDFPAVASHHAKYLSEHFPSVKVFYLCGADHAIKYCISFPYLNSNYLQINNQVYVI